MPGFYRDPPADPVELLALFPSLWYIFSLWFYTILVYIFFWFIDIYKSLERQPPESRNGEKIYLLFFLLRTGAPPLTGIICFRLAVVSGYLSGWLAVAGGGWLSRRGAGRWWWSLLVTAGWLETETEGQQKNRPQVRMRPIYNIPRTFETLEKFLLDKYAKTW